MKKKLKQQNEAVKKAKDLEWEINNWFDCTGYLKDDAEYRQTKGMLQEAVAPINIERFKKLIENM